MSLPADLDIEQAYDESEREAIATLDREAGVADSFGRSDKPGSFYSRDYIPSDKDAQSTGQRKYLEETARRADLKGPSDFIPGKKAPVDRTPEEKQRFALEASIKWQEQYAARLRAKAAEDVMKLPETTLIMLLQNMGTADRNVYLQEEAQLKNRDRVFQMFGKPVYTAEEEQAMADEAAQPVGKIPPDEVPAATVAGDSPESQDADTIDKNTYIPDETEDKADDLEGEPDITGIDQGGKDE